MPSFAFCLTLKDAANPYGGIKTSENLLPGDVLAVEAPLAWIPKPTFQCEYCRRVCGSLKPCKCGLVWFCSPKCEEEAFHNYECFLMDRLVKFPLLDNLVFRVFLKLIQRFNDVAKLREYLDSVKSPNPFKADDFEAWSDPESFESKFRLYYATECSSVVTDNKNIKVSMAKTSILINMLKSCKQIPCLARNEEEWAFLSELLFGLIVCKASTVLNIPSFTREKKYVQGANNEIKLEATDGFPIKGLHGAASLLRSSHQANVDMRYEGNKLIVRALKYIPRGTELLRSQK